MGGEEMTNEEFAPEAGGGGEMQAEMQAAPQKLRTYTVKKGDTLSEIGERFGVSWKKIAKLNHVDNPDLIHPGQEFKIPND